MCIPWCKTPCQLGKALNLCRLPNACCAVHAPLHPSCHYHIRRYGCCDSRDHAQSCAVVPLWSILKNRSQRWPGVRFLNACVAGHGGEKRHGDGPHENIKTLRQYQQTHHGRSLQHRSTLRLPQSASHRLPQQPQCSLRQVPRTTPWPPKRLCLPFHIIAVAACQYPASCQSYLGSLHKTWYMVPELASTPKQSGERPMTILRDLMKYMTTRKV